MPATESGENITITSNSNWSISCNQSWISPNIFAGNGNSDFSFTTSANPETTPRTAIITVTMEGGNSKTITVSQNGKDQPPTDPEDPGNSFLPITYIYISSESTNVPVDITSDSDWEISADQSWINVNPESGTFSQSITLMLGANPSYIPRTGTVIVFEAGIASQLLIVTQDGNEIFPDNSGNDDSNEIYSKRINITGNKSKALINIASAPTTVTSDQNWVTVNPGNGDQTISFAIEPNPTNISRTAIVTVYSDGVAEQTIKITQEAGATTGIGSPVNAHKILVYPNPTSGNVKLKFDQIPQNGIQLTVFDLTGKTILHQLIRNQEEWIDLKGNSPGVYFLKTDQKNQTTQKLILK